MSERHSAADVANVLGVTDSAKIAYLEAILNIEWHRGKLAGMQVMREIDERAFPRPDEPPRVEGPPQ